MHSVKTASDLSLIVSKGLFLSLGNFPRLIKKSAETTETVNLRANKRLAAPIAAGGKKLLLN
ncbi:MAG: hypothetical protein LVQ75_05675 [Candidatus Babeliales bacterium]|jgi:hypothetical protein